MTGVGHSGGAGTVVNAMATGFGAAFGLRLGVTARAEAAPAPAVRNAGVIVPPDEARLVQECVGLIDKAHGPFGPVAVDIESQIPARKGLKSSSAVAIAVLRAVAALRDVDAPNERVLDWAAEAGLRSHTSRTGAYDDASACLLGGLVLTDNTHRRLLEHRALPDDLTAFIHIPPGENPTQRYRDVDLESVKEPAARAFELARKGKIRQAMLTNTLAYANVFGINPRFTQEALDAGAWAAGLSGTGPAEIALVATRNEDRVQDLRPDLRRVELTPRGAA